MKEERPCRQPPLLPAAMTAASLSTAATPSSCLSRGGGPSSAGEWEHDTRGHAAAAAAAAISAAAADRARGLVVRLLFRGRTFVGAPKLTAALR